MRRAVAFFLGFAMSFLILILPCFECHEQMANAVQVGDAAAARSASGSENQMGFGPGPGKTEGGRSNDEASDGEKEPHCVVASS